MNLSEIEVPPGKTLCVNDRGEASVVNDATAQNKHWQRSTGYKPYKRPVVENLPPLTETPEPAPKKQSRPSKTSETK